MSFVSGLNLDKYSSSFYAFLIELFEFNVYFRFGEKRVKSELQELKEKHSKLTKTKSDGWSMFEQTIIGGFLHEYDHHRNKIILVQLNTTFENYVMDFSFRLLQKYPEMLDECQVKMSEVRTKSIEDVIDTKIEEFIRNQVMDNSFKKIFENINKKFKISADIDSEIFNKLDEFREIRNLIVHRNCIVDRKFKDKYTNVRYKLGKKLMIKNEYLQDIEHLIVKTISSFDQELIKKHSFLIPKEIILGLPKDLDDKFLEMFES